MDIQHFMTIFGIVFASTGFWQLIQYLIQTKRHKRTAIEDGVLGLLHDKIYYLARKYIAEGNISHSEYDNLSHLWKPYQEMGGNGTAAKLMKEVEKLPITED